MKQISPIDHDQSERVGYQERQGSTLHEAVVALERRLHKKANRLDRRRCSTDNYTHWKARGSQKTLREVATNLRAMRREYRSAHALHIVLDGYLHCLETSREDALEETRRPHPKRGLPILQWKAEGEMLVLPGICSALSRLLQENVYSTRVLPVVGISIRGSERFADLSATLRQDETCQSVPTTFETIPLQGKMDLVLVNPPYSQQDEKHAAFLRLQQKLR